MFKHFKKCLVKLETLSLLAFLVYIKYFFVIDLTPCASLGTKIGRLCAGMRSNRALFIQILIF